VDPADAPLDERGFDERYQQKHLLGAGGMGEVHLSRDGRIGRDVAIKVARAGGGSSPAGVMRFAREARVQGQLEHPSIVPVYDLGKRPDGAAYFTMRRVRGVTLEQILQGQRSGNAELAAAHSRRKLLTAFGQVCQAVHFAHTRGVLHRDLKPSNIMLGDYGEVYVLDWGLAKLVAETEEPVAQDGERERERERDKVHVESSGAATTSGAVMGTPGYMAPEQLRGEIEQLDARTDVYALGAILFEILALEPLHPREDIPRAMTSTLEGADARATRRAPDRDVPPELEAVCVRATALAPGDRFASARELVEAVERYLDGDRDLARRRELAGAWAEAADAQATRALAEGGGASERQEALQLAGRALALDPQHPGAMGALIRLLLAPPAKLPPEVDRDLEQAETRMVRVAAVKGGWTYLSWFLFVPLLFWLGTKDLRLLVPWGACILACAAISLLGSRVERINASLHFAVLGLSSVAIMLMSPIWSPFVLTPLLAAVNTIAFLIHSRPKWRVPTVGIGALSIVLPILGEVAGVLPQTIFFEHDGIVIRSWVVHHPPVPTLAVVLLSLLGCLVVPALYVSRVRGSLVSAERALHVQSWHLRQLIPSQAQDALAPALEQPGPLLACAITTMIRRE
jgi:serine/threonine-protein kinase